MKRSTTAKRLILALCILFITTIICCSADVAFDPNKATPRAISVTSRVEPNIQEGIIKNIKMMEMLNKNRQLTNLQFVALSPLLVQSILEASRQGEIYKVSNKNPDKIYFDIPITYAAILKHDLLAELIDANGEPIEFDESGKPQKTWIVWRNYPTYLKGQFDDVVCDSCPVVDRDKIEEIGITLHLFQNINKKRVTFVKIPLFPIRQN